MSKQGKSSFQKKLADWARPIFNELVVIAGGLSVKKQRTKNKRRSVKRKPKEVKVKTVHAVTTVKKVVDVKPPSKDEAVVPPIVPSELSLETVRPAALPPPLRSTVGESAVVIPSPTPVLPQTSSSLSVLSLPASPSEFSDLPRLIVAKLPKQEGVRIVLKPTTISRRELLRQRWGLIASRSRRKTVATETASVAKTETELTAVEPVTTSEVDTQTEGRPRNRCECREGPRPCVYVSCPYHLFLDVNPKTGSIKFNFPGKEIWELDETCALDVADRGGVTLEEIGDLMHLTRERVRQLEEISLSRVKDKGGLED